MAATKKALNKKIRQEALREQLSKGKHIQHVLEIADKLNEQHLSLEATAISALKTSADIKMKLINKYLPDLKMVEAEVTGLDGNPIEVDQQWTVEFVNAPTEG